MGVGICVAGLDGFKALWAGLLSFKVVWLRIHPTRVCVCGLGRDEWGKVCVCARAYVRARVFVSVSVHMYVCARMWVQLLSSSLPADYHTPPSHVLPGGQGLEEEAAKVLAQIEAGKADKGLLLEKLVEAEREVGLHACACICVWVLHVDACRGLYLSNHAPNIIYCNLL